MPRATGGGKTPSFAFATPLASTSYFSTFTMSSRSPHSLVHHSPHPFAALTLALPVSQLLASTIPRFTFPSFSPLIPFLRPHSCIPLYTHALKARLLVPILAVLYEHINAKGRWAHTRRCCYARSGKQHQLYILRVHVSKALVEREAKVKRLFDFTHSGTTEESTVTFCLLRILLIHSF